MRIEFLAAAEEELQQAAQFYERQVVGLGALFLDEVQHAAQAIAEAVNAGPPFVGDIRRRLVRRFPFALLYAVNGSLANQQEGIVLIIAVMHQRRKPGYWRERLSSPE